jgi:hypothetical protein
LRPRPGHGQPPSGKRRSKSLHRIAVLAAASLFVAPAHAAPFVAYYDATWGSLPAGHLVASFDDDNRAYRDSLQMDTVGLPQLLLHFRARVESAGTFAANGAVQPVRFDVDYDLRKYRDQRVRVTYVASDRGFVAERTPQDTNRKPPLPEDYRRNVIDPLAAFAALRQLLLRHDAKAGDHFILSVFDDVRRFNVAVSIRSAGGARKLVWVHLDLMAVAGFRRKDDRYAPEEAPRPIDVTFRDDGMMTPLQLDVTVAWLPLVVRFDHHCDDLVHCTAKHK